MGYWQSVGNAILGRLTPGKYYWSIVESVSSWGKKSSTDKKIKLILENPAALYIFTLLCDLATLAKPVVEDEDGQEVEHPILDLLNKPNFFQTYQQFVWDYMFHRKMGTANLYIDSIVIRPENVMYWMRDDHIKWPDTLTKQKHKIVLSQDTINEWKKTELTYNAPNQNFKFEYEKLLQFFDISNGLQGWFESPSRVDALYKIVSNSENALKAKNINADFASKWIVSGKVGIEQTSQLQMGEKDKANIRETMRSSETIFPTKTQTAINRFVEQGSIFESLDKAYMTDAFLIGKILNIPKDVIEMLGDATYENQEKATAKMTSYALQPDMDDLASGLWKYFEGEEGLALKFKFDHLPFNQVFEKEKAETNEKKANAFDKLVRAGADQEEVASIVGLGLTEFSEPIQGSSSNQGAEPKQLKIAK